MLSSWLQRHSIILNVYDGWETKWSAGWRSIDPSYSGEVHETLGPSCNSHDKPLGRIISM